MARECGRLCFPLGEPDHSVDGPPKPLGMPIAPPPGVPLQSPLGREGAISIEKSGMIRAPGQSPEAALGAEKSQYSLGFKGDFQSPPLFCRLIRRFVHTVLISGKTRHQPPATRSRQHDHLRQIRTRLRPRAPSGAARARKKQFFRKLLQYRCTFPYRFWNCRIESTTCLLTRLQTIFQKGRKSNRKSAVLTTKSGFWRP